MSLIEKQLVANVLNNDTIQKMLDGQLLAVHVPNYYSHSLKEKLFDRFYQDGFHCYQHDYNTIGHIGLSSYGIDDNVEAFSQYYKNALLAQEKVEAFFAPDISVMTQFVGDLNQHWTAGAQKALLHNDPMFAGIIRLIPKKSSVHAHQDLVAWSNPNSKLVNTITKQLAMNVYLSTPSTGGELLIWDCSYDKETFDDLAEGEFYILPRKLPEPTLRLKPNEGDLIVFNCRNLHAISQSTDKDRIACSCFIGYTNNEQPLVFWS